MRERVERWRKWLPWPAAAPLVAALLYLPSLGYQFVFDDPFQITNNPRLESWAAFPGYFTQHLWAHMLPAQYANYYRPAFLLWLKLNAVLFGVGFAPSWHLSSVLLHVLAASLVFVLVRDITQDVRAAGWGALIFASHPTHLEAVGWISGANETLFTCFFLWALISFRRVVVAGTGWQWLSFGLACACTLFSKEGGIILFLVLACWQWLERRRFGSRGTSAVLLCVVLTAGYCVARWFALHGWSHTPLDGSVMDLLRTLPVAVSFYLRHLFYAPPYAFYGYGVLFPGSAFPVVAVVVSVVLISTLLILARRVTHGWLALVLISVPLLPAIVNLRAFISHDIVHDRYLMMSTVGLALLAAEWISRNSMTKPVAAACVLLYAAAVMTMEPQWKSNYALFSISVAHSPRSSFARVLLSNELLARGQHDEAVQQLRTAIDVDPHAPRAYYSLGKIFVADQRCADAIPLLQRAIDLDARNGDVFYQRAVCEQREGHADSALQDAERAVELFPKQANAYALLGDIAAQLNRIDLARRAYQLELQLEPDDQRVRRKLDALR
ncbi:MAG TPA: tetratricopeptide repeat protein [Terriglobales bacterium]